VETGGTAGSWVDIPLQRSMNSVQALATGVAPR
jgi:hypothetical protein